MTWVLLSKFAELTGYTEEAVRCKIKKGIWEHGSIWRKAGGRIHLNLRGYDAWVAARDQS